MPNIKTLDEKTQEFLEEILNKNPEDLTRYEAGFLRARASYLTYEQKQTFSKALGGSSEGISVNDEKGMTIAPEKKVIRAKDYKLDVLRQMVKDAGLSFNEDMTKDQLADLLNAR